jgi:aminomethyltransferase
MKDIALKQQHIDLGAKMVEFAGYYMPLQYSGLTDEHLAIRNNVGVFDVSHMGEFVVKGKEALDFLQKVTSNDVSKLQVGKVQYSCLPNANGGIVDDLLVYMLKEEEYLLVVNASNIEKDWNWLMQFMPAELTMMNRSDELSLFAIQGPNATKVLETLTDLDLQSMTYYTFDVGTVAGCKEVLVSATGYTGAGGFEVYCENADAVQVFNAIMDAGKAFGIQPAGLAARDTLRLEMGFCLYGNDIDDETSPIEAGLGWITKFTKEFTNSQALLKQKEEGVNRKLVGFEINERGIPRKGYLIVDESGKEVGVVTSGTMSPSLNKGIGLAYVAVSHLPASALFVEIRNKKVRIQIVKLPFFKAK